MTAINRLFDIYEICALIASFFTNGHDLYALTLVSRQFHHSFNPFLWRECNIFLTSPDVLTSTDAHRPYEGRRYNALGRQMQQPTNYALARMGHLIRSFSLKIFKSNVSTFILDLMRLNARHLVSLSIASEFMSTDDFKEQVMGLAPIMIDFAALCGSNDVDDECSDTFHPSTDSISISLFDHGLLSHTITTLKLELKPSVVKEVLPAIIAARKQDDRVLAGLMHFLLECEDLHSQSLYTIAQHKSLPLSIVHGFLDVFPKLETLCTSFMAIVEDKNPPLDEIPTSRGQESPPQGTSPRLQGLEMTAHSPKVLASLLARTFNPLTMATTPRTNAAASTIDSTESALPTASGLRRLMLTRYTGESLIATVAEHRLSNLEHFSYSFQGRFTSHTPSLESHQDQVWTALWKSLPQLRSLSTICVILTSQDSRSLVAHCPRLEKFVQLSAWEQDPARDPGWGGILETIRGGNGLKNLQFNRYVGVKFFYRMIRHPTPLSTLLLEGSRGHYGHQSITEEQRVGHLGQDEQQEANEMTGTGATVGVHQEAIQELNNIEMAGSSSHVLGSVSETAGDEEDEDEDDQDYVYVDDSDDDTENHEDEGEVVDGDEDDEDEDYEDEEEQERESIAQCLSTSGCFNSLEILRIYRLNLNGPAENHIFRQAIRLLGRLWHLQVSGTGLEKWALLDTGDIGLRCGMDMPKNQYIYPNLQEVYFSRISEDTKDDIESIVAIIPKLLNFRTIGLNLNSEEIRDMRNNKETTDN